MRVLMLVAVAMIVLGLTMHLRGPRRAEAVVAKPAVTTTAPVAPAPRAASGDKNPPGG